MKRPTRPAANPDEARKALRLFEKNVRGDELAHRLKLSYEQAMLLVGIGTLIAHAESLRLTDKQSDVMKVIARVIARKILLGHDYAKPSEVDFAGSFRRGTCKKHIVALVGIGLVEMALTDQVRLTRAGWAFCWEKTALIKQNWTVPA